MGSCLHPGFGMKSQHFQKTSLDQRWLPILANSVALRAARSETFERKARQLVGTVLELALGQQGDALAGDEDRLMCRNRTGLDGDAGPNGRTGEQLFYDTTARIAFPGQDPVIIEQIFDLQTRAPCQWVVAADGNPVVVSK